MGWLHTLFSLAQSQPFTFISSSEYDNYRSPLLCTRQMTLLAQRTIQNRIMSTMAKHFRGRRPALRAVHCFSRKPSKVHFVFVQNDFQSLFGLSAHIKRLIQDSWWTRQQYQCVYNLILSKHLLLRLMCCQGNICLTIMKFFYVLTEICLEDSTPFVCVRVRGCGWAFPPCVVIALRGQER